MSRVLVIVGLVGLLALGAAKDPLPPSLPMPTKPLPVDDPKKAAVVLLDDAADRLIPYLNNDGEYSAQNTPAAVEEVDVYSGAAALRVNPQQRFRGTLPGWSYPIREKPQAGEFRYVRFAWKKVGGTGVIVQFHNADNHPDRWNQRYYAGQNVFGWSGKSVAEAIPTEWTVVTRDLHADFGNFTLTGVAFSPADGTAGLFDHVLLGRTEADLDALSAELLGKVKPKQPLAGTERETTWEAFGSRDVEKAAPAVRAFLATAPDQVAFLRERLAAGGGRTPEQERALCKRIAELVAKLGDDDFDTRRAADAELEKLGEAARDEIHEAAKSPTPEVAFRAKGLTGRLKFADFAVPTAAVRGNRVVRVLERAASDEAKKLLGELAAGDFGPHAVEPAKAALARLSK